MVNYREKTWEELVEILESQQRKNSEAVKRFLEKNPDYYKRPRKPKNTRRDTTVVVF